MSTFGIGLQAEPKASGRGRAGTVVGIPGFWADIDIKGPAHKRQDLPETREEALAVLSEFPPKPTLIVDSGHGLQAWWLFNKPWMFESESEWREAKELARRFQSTLKEIFRKRGFHLDNTSDLARVLRLPGTVNRKREPKEVHVL